MRKVWTYLSSRALSDTESTQLLQEGKRFVNTWTAHDNPLKADFQLHKQRILIVTVDEEVHNASGCSIDKLLRFVKETEKSLRIDLLNRLLVAIDDNDAVKVVPASDIPALLATGILNAESPIYNTAISTEAELATWLQPLNQTWLKKYLWHG